MSVFDLAQITAQTVVAQIDFHQRLDSTNDRAIELLKNGHPELPLLVLTENQVAGRGQGNRKWIASEGSLTFTLCFPGEIGNPGFATSNPASIDTLLPLTTALAVCQAIEATVDPKRMQIKWPNDVLINGLKVCGILIEKIVSNGNSIFVIGIGINVNNEVDFNPSVDSAEASLFKPTSLLVQSGNRLDLMSVLIRVINELSSEMKAVHHQPASVVSRCQARLIFLEQHIELALPNNQTLAGKCVGLGSNGELLVETANKTERVFSGRVIRS